jgi:hypothetical protein
LKERGLEGAPGWRVDGDGLGPRRVVRDTNGSDLFGALFALLANDLRADSQRGAARYG